MPRKPIPLLATYTGSHVACLQTELAQMWAGRVPAPTPKPFRHAPAPTQNPLTSVQDFFSNVLGGNWTQHMPASWAMPSFNWNTLGTFEYTNNLQYFLQNVNLTKPTSLADMANQLAEAEAAFCTEEV